MFDGDGVWWRGAVMVVRGGSRRLLGIVEREKCELVMVVI